MAVWVKMIYDRQTLIFDLASVGTFHWSRNDKLLSFWLPDQSLQVFLNPQEHPDEYLQVISYINELPLNPSNYWITLAYERSRYVINLNQVNTFKIAANGRLSFYLPGTNKTVVMAHQTEPEDYAKIQTYVLTTTGYTLPEPWGRTYGDLNPGSTRQSGYSQNDAVSDERSVS